MIKSFGELAAATREKIGGGEAPAMGVIYPHSGKYIEAVVQAAADGYVKPVLYGPVAEIKKTAVEKNMNIDNIEIVDATDPENALLKAFADIEAGEIRFLLKGDIATRELVELLLKPQIGFVGRGTTLSHIGLIQTPKYHKLMFITDGAVNAESDANVKIAVARNAASLAGKLGIETPRAALLAAVEAVYPAVPVTMEEAAIAKMSDRGQIKEVLIDGPLSFDVAIDADIARSKGIVDSKVAGETDIFVGPSMETANGMYKAMIMYAGAEAAGVIYGGAVTIVSTFTADPVKNVINSIVLGAYLAVA